MQTRIAGGAALCVAVLLVLGVGAGSLSGQGGPPPSQQQPPPPPAPAPGRGGAAGLGAGPIDMPLVDRASADRGRTVYAAQCITCHGTQARGTDTKL